MQRPAVAFAGEPGDVQLHPAIVPSPDEGRGNGDAGKVVRRDRRRQWSHEAPHGSPDSRGAETIQGVRRHRFPALTHLAAHPIEVDEAVVANAAFQPSFGRSQHHAGKGERHP
jgi:hypothetical protein